LKGKVLKEFKECPLGVVENHGCITSVRVTQKSQFEWRSILKEFASYLEPKPYHTLPRETQTLAFRHTQCIQLEQIKRTLAPRVL